MEPLPERMVLIHLVGTVAQDHEHESSHLLKKSAAAHLRKPNPSTGDHPENKIKGRFRGGNNVNEFNKHIIKPVLGLIPHQLFHRLLFADNQFKFRKNSGQDPALIPDGRFKSPAELIQNRLF